MSDKAEFKGLVGRRAVRESFTALVRGVHGSNADLYIPITDAKTTSYDTPTSTDAGYDMTPYFCNFVFQLGDPQNGHTLEYANTEVQMNVSGTWAAVPLSISDPSGGAVDAVMTDGSKIIFMVLPVPGVRLRLKVTAPGASTNFKACVRLSETIDKSDVRRI